MAMTAGEATDKLVATEALGWRHNGGHWQNESGDFVGQACPMLSGTFAAAEHVLDWLVGRWGGLRLDKDEVGWTAFPKWSEDDIPAMPVRLMKHLCVRSETMPLALCRAALLESLNDYKKEGNHGT